MLRQDSLGRGKGIGWPSCPTALWSNDSVVRTNGEAGERADKACGRISDLSTRFVKCCESCKMWFFGTCQ